MSLFTIIKDKLRVLRSRSKKTVKEVQRFILEELIQKQSDQAPLSGFFDNIGPVTASMIIHRQIDKYIYAVCGSEELINNKRFYIARTTEANGSVIKTSLVDKQNGMTRTLYYKYVDKSSP